MSKLIYYCEMCGEEYSTLAQARRCNKACNSRYKKSKRIAKDINKIIGNSMIKKRDYEYRW